MTGKTEGITYLKQVTEKLKLRLEELNRLIDKIRQIEAVLDIERTTG